VPRVDQRSLASVLWSLRTIFGRRARSVTLMSLSLMSGTADRVSAPNFSSTSSKWRESGCAEGSNWTPHFTENRPIDFTSGKDSRAARFFFQKSCSCIGSMETVRTKLRQALSDKLVPAILAAGFKGPLAIRGNALRHDYRRTIPSGETHVLTIQLEKRQRPRFLLTLYVEPAEGINQVIARGGRIVSGSLTARPGPFSRSWFRADRSWWHRVVLRQTDTLEREAVTLCLSYLPEVERWWSNQQPSEHINSFPVTYPGTTEFE
jgi:hypothetical protein